MARLKPLNRIIDNKKLFFIFKPEQYVPFSIYAGKYIFFPDIHSSVTCKYSGLVIDNIIGSRCGRGRKLVILRRSFAVLQLLRLENV